MKQLESFKNIIGLTVFTLLSTLTSFAQTITIGTGTGTSGVTQVTPYKTFWEDGRCQLLVTASEMISAGAPVGGNITNLAFNVTATNAQALNGFTIRMGHTSLTALTNVFQPNGSFTTCFSSNIGGTSMGWNTYTFTNQFNWNGSSNIIVEVCFDNTAWAGNSSVEVSTTAFNSNTSANADGVTGCTMTNGMLVGSSRPNIRMNLTPSTPCTAPPTGGTANASISNPCPSEGTTISVSGGTIGAGATFQWQSSPDNSTWSNITTGGTSSIFTTTVTTPTFFRRQITCSTQTAFSSSVLVTPKTFIQCYCTAGASSAFDSDIGKVKFSLGCTTILENGFDSPATNNANATGTYTSFINTVPPARFVKGFTHDAELYYVSRGTYYQAHFNVFIDYNKNGVFDANERVANVAGTAGGANGKAGASRVSFTIPATVDTGFTGMRVYMQEGGNAFSGPCGTFTWGEVEDYMVRIVNAPDMQITSVVSPVNNSCGTDPTRVTVTVRNNSTTDTSFFNTARAVISGSLNTTLNGSMCRMLLPGQSDTIQFPVTINTIAGGNFNIRTFPNVASDPNFNNDTTSVNITISPLPATPTVIRGTPFKGTFDQGTLQQPDYVASNDTIFYELTAPVGFDNTQYGTIWLPSVTVKTLAGNNLSNFTLIAPSGGVNARVRIIPQASEVDSVYEMATRFYFVTSGCDTTVKRIIYIAPRPVSRFGNSISCFGTATQFTDSSTLVRGTMSYEWDFGDAGNADTSTAQNPSYLFSGPGDYTVTLTTTSNLGYKNTITKLISVGYTPVPSFTYTNQCDGKPFNFKNTSTIAGNQTTLTYVWEFLNDNTSATTTDVTKLYNGVGNYDVKLTAKSVLNCQASLTRTVNVFPVPDADFSAGNACTGKITNLTNASTVQYGDLGYFWTLGNGSNSTDKNPAAQYSTTGTKTIKLLVTTEFGCADSVTKTITVAETPVANFATQANCSADSVVFTNSTTGSGTINSSWTFGDGNTSTTNATTVKNLYNTSGSYTVKLTAVNGNCTDEISKQIDVYPSPEADFSTSGNACFGTLTQFTNNSTGNALSNNWNFGIANATSSNQNPTFTYPAAGTYNVKLVVTTDKGCSDSLSQQVVVYALPNASFSKSFNTSPTQNLQRQRQVILSPADSNYFSYFWNMGDGTEYQQIKPVHNYQQDGKYYITLKVEDSRGCENTFLDSVIFNLSSVAGLSTSNNSVSVYPNPFRNSTNVSFVLAKQSEVAVTVYDLVGREVKQLYNGISKAGLHQIEFSTADLSSNSAGYIIRVVIDGKSYTKQVIEIK
jgi:PKD repeat protein